MLVFAGGLAEQCLVSKHNLPHHQVPWLYSMNFTSNSRAVTNNKTSTYVKSTRVSSLVRRTVPARHMQKPSSNRLICLSIYLKYISKSGPLLELKDLVINMLCYASRPSTSVHPWRPRKGLSHTAHNKDTNVMQCKCHVLATILPQCS